MNWKSGPFLSGSADALTVDEGASLASKASLATDFPVGNAAGPACADSVGTANGHAGTKPFAGAGDSVPFDWIGSGSSAALGRAGADVGIAGIGSPRKAQKKNCLLWPSACACPLPPNPASK